ncbi:MAG: hypothetical protein A2722_02875 [Candidatus Doudnabacteria bacterium RIFCSPHIGHO2_01_FULL_50_11]|uniref:Glycosyltransferase RgtA/B/C/D-like domain-containing protein n=1 Tax=Candidatus Doudnabacteria bacterium RIFCSPHIGHO2_01_FULL_50_11 TaxID=1817828 RepID=A0A1F5PHA9_9BACT|nr:MAG: hypothetical protein A2722_02875 [Candidatus Doudnabacteria bacterium RIFCSPHIGHO2_01_FULL_50_11]
MSTASSFHHWSHGLKESGDALEYHDLAINLLTTHRFEEHGELSASRDPGYVFFLASLYAVGGSSVSVLVIQIIMFALIALLVFSIARELTGSGKIASFAGFLSAIFYPLAGYAGVQQTEIFFTLVFLTSIFLLLKAHRDHSWVTFALCGIAFGVAILTRSIILFLPLVLFACGVFIYRKERWFWRGWVICACCVIAFVFPWMFRNKLLFNEFVVSEKAGTTIFFASQRLLIPDKKLPQVFVANTLGDFFARKIFGSYDRQAVEEGDYGVTLEALGKQGLSGTEFSRRAGELGLQRILADPIRYAFVVPPIEFLKMHTPIFPYESIQGLFSDPARYPSVPDGLKGAVILAIRALYALIYFCALWGMVTRLPRWQNKFFLLAALGYYVAVYAILHGVPRYLLPVFPLYLVFLAVGYQAYRQWRTSRLNAHTL